MKDKWLETMLIFVVMITCVITWGFMIWTWHELGTHENALRNHAAILQKLIPAPQKNK